METFDLNVENGILVNLHALGLLQIILQGRFCVFLDCSQIAKHLLVILISKQLFQIGTHRP